MKDAINSCDELNNINRYQYSSSTYKLIQLQLIKLYQQR